jgi:capsular polysaccharide biosynthesis protein
MLSNPPTSATQQRGGAPLLDGRGGSGLDGVLSVLRRWRAVLAAAALTGLVCGYLVASAATPSYESRAVMLVGPINGDLDTLRAAGQLAQTYAQIATSRPTVNATGRRLGLSGLDGSIHASANPLTRLLTIEARDEDPVRAARIANAHADELAALARLRASTGPGELHTIEAAQAATSPSGPGPVLLALGAALVALLAAAGLALLMDRFGATVRGVEDVATLTGAGTVGTLGTRAWRAASASTVPATAAGDYRLLAGRLRAIGERSLLIADVDRARPGVAANLVAALSASGTRATLLEADARELRQVVSAEDARQLLDDQLAAADMVVVYAPPIQRSPAALVWARVVDGTLLVARVDRTPRRDLAIVTDSLRLAHARLLGTVLGPRPGLLGR